MGQSKYCQICQQSLNAHTSFVHQRLPLRKHVSNKHRIVDLISINTVISHFENFRTNLKNSGQFVNSITFQDRF